MGFERDAREIMIRRRRLEMQSAAGSWRPQNFWQGLLVPVRWLFWRLLSPVRWAYAKLTRFGYDTRPLFVMGALFIVTNAAVYQWASYHALIAPAHTVAMRSEWWHDCATAAPPAASLTDWTAIMSGPTDLNGCLNSGPRAEDRYVDYPAFNSWIFSIDTFVPLVDLGQERFWQASSRTAQGARLQTWQAVYVGLGWLFSSLAVAGIVARFNKRGAE
jgi:hypothetical protein